MVPLILGLAYASPAQAEFEISPQVSMPVFITLVVVLVVFVIATFYGLLKLDSKIPLHQITLDKHEEVESVFPEYPPVPLDFYRIERPKVVCVLDDEAFIMKSPVTNLTAESLKAYGDGSCTFPVKIPYERKGPKEMDLSIGERIVVVKVYQDGWALGVSKRRGGPLLFPLWHLAGPIPTLMWNENSSPSVEVTTSIPGQFPTGSNLFVEE
jgi:hypothetical protein